MTTLNGLSRPWDAFIQTIFDKMGHYVRHCPDRRAEYKRKNMRHHAHAVEDEEPSAKMSRE
jgi:hypothetical protein